jgi:hypothetical protein
MRALRSVVALSELLAAEVLTLSYLAWTWLCEGRVVNNKKGKVTGCVDETRVDLPTATECRGTALVHRCCTQWRTRAQRPRADVDA